MGQTKTISLAKLPKPHKPSLKSKKVETSQTSDCELLMTAEMARQMVLKTQPKAKAVMEATEMASLRQRRFQVLPCPKSGCSGQFLFVGRSKLPGGRLSAAGVRICTVCGRHERSQV